MQVEAANLGAGVRASQGSDEQVLCGVGQDVAARGAVSSHHWSRVPLAAKGSWRAEWAA